MIRLFPQNVPYPWLKPGVFAGSLIPLVVMTWRGTRGELGADIVAIVLNEFGYLALIFLAATLLCTPLKIVTGWTWGIRLRRMLGLFAFFYASLHFLTYVVVDQTLNLGAVLADIAKRKFILVGFLTLVIMIPLAITSTQKMTRRLGFVRWKRLHRLVYLAGCLGAIHFIWRVKIDLLEPFIFFAIIAGGLALRVFEAFRKPEKKPKATTAVPSST